jgi:EAL domain-containing protein (putative c-di-GMP-specific phosphodiesterase class I)
MSSGTVPERSLADLVESFRRGQAGQSLMELAVAAARQHLGMDVSLLSEFRDGQQVYRRIDGDGGSFGMREDSGRALEDTFCRRVVAGDAPAVIPDASAEPAVAGLPAIAEAGIGAYVGVPVRLPDGRLYGTLCCFSHDPDPDLRDRDARFLEVLAAIVGEQLGREQGELEHRRALTDRVDAVIREGRVGIAFQPIVGLADRRPVGYEALARIDTDPYRTPDLWFADAWEVGRGADLELIAVRAALAHLGSVPDDAYLSVNVSPVIVGSPAFAGALRESDPRRILVEVTEHAIPDHYDVLAHAMRALRGTGVRFAVDDAGAGYAGLTHMVRLAPDVIKLDRFLISGLDADPARQALAAAAASFADRSRTHVIAEGIETVAEHEQLRELGIRYGQGYHYARPLPPAEVWPTPPAPAPAPPTRAPRTLAPQPAARPPARRPG